MEQKDHFAEWAVAGSILIDGACLPAIALLLEPEDFSDPMARAIYKGALTLYRSGTPIDPVAIQQAAAQDGFFLSDDQILSLMETTPTANNAVLYGKTVRNAAQVKKIHAFALSLAAETETPGCNGTALITAATATLSNLLDAWALPSLHTPQTLLSGFSDYRNALEQGKGAFCPTGFPPLDHLLGGGFLNGGLYLLGGRPGIGKTTLALNLADEMAARGHPVLFLSLEMGPEQIMAKRIARLSGLSATRLLMGKLTEREQEKVAEATSTLKQFPFYLNETGKVTLHTLSSMARQVKGLHCVFIDYIGLLSISSGRWKTRYEEMTALSGALKQLARSLEVPVVCLSQLNRAGEGRAEKKPSLSDLRDSGALEQDADGVLLLWRPAATGVNPEPLELMVAKNRHAATGAVTLRFSGKTSKIAI